LCWGIGPTRPPKGWSSRATQPCWSRAVVTVVTGLSGTAPRQRELPDINPAGPLALSPDGRWLADALPDGGVRLRDLTDQSSPRSVPNTGGTGRTVQDLRFSPDSARLAWLEAGAPGRVTLVIKEVSSGADIPQYLGPLPAADPFTFSLTADPNLIVLRYAPDPAATSTRVVVRSLADGAQAASLPGNAEVSHGLALWCDAGPDQSSKDSAVVVTPIGGKPAAQADSDRNRLFRCPALRGRASGW